MAAVLALVVGAIVAGSRGDDAPGPGEALVSVDGLARVVRADGSTDEVRGRARLGPGDRLRVVRGAAELELADDVRYSAVGPRRAPGGEAAGVDGAGVEGTELVMGRVPRLQAGPLLVVAPRGAALRAGAGVVRLEPSSVARVTRTMAGRVDVFAGRATLDSEGASQGVPALRSAEAVAPGEVTRTRPLTYAADDAWDRRYLGGALALDEQLATLAAGLRASGIAPQALAERIRAGLAEVPPAATVRPLLARRTDRIDAALGLAVVGAAERDRFAARWRSGFRFHDAGAPWGLVALDLGADPDAVVDVIADAIDRADRGAEGTTGELAGAPADGTRSDGAADPSTDGVAPADTASPAPADGAGPGAADPAGGPASTVPGGSGGLVPPATVPVVTLPPGPQPPVPLPSLPPLTIPTVTTVVDALDGATGGLVSDVGTTVGGVLSPVTGPVTGTGGLLGGVTGSGGLLAPVTGSGGLVPLGP